MTKSKTTIKVIEGFDGLVGSGSLKETIERKVTKCSIGEGKNIRYQHGRYWVNYQGRRYISFVLPPVYGELAGVCIDAKDLYW